MSINKKTNEMPQIPEHVRKRIYGQTRTLVDILCAMNDKEHFKTPHDALNAISDFTNSVIKHGDEIAWNCSIRSVNAFAQERFTGAGLDIDKLQSMIEKDWDENEISLAYMHYVLLHQGPANSIRRLAAKEAAEPFLHQALIPNGDFAMKIKSLDLLSQLAQLPVYELTCTISQAAVDLSLQALHSSCQCEP